MWVPFGALCVAAVAVLLWASSAPDEESPEKVIEVEIGRYEYDPGSTIALNVSQGDFVRLRLTSTDVTHGFAITEYGINVEVPPGQTVEVRFRATQAGDFVIYCTVFCGSGHPEHKGTLHVA